MAPAFSSQAVCVPLGASPLVGQLGPKDSGGLAGPFFTLSGHHPLSVWPGARCPPLWASLTREMGRTRSSLVGCGSGGRIGEGCRRGARRCPRDDVARLCRVDTAEWDGVCSCANDRSPSPLLTRRCHSPPRARRLGQDGMKGTGGRWTPGRGRPGLESVLGWEHSKVLNGGVLMDRAGLGGSSRASTKGHSKGEAPNAEGNALRPPGRAWPVGVVLGHLQRAHTAQCPMCVSQLCSCPCEVGLPGLEVTIMGEGKGGDTWARRAPHFLLQHRGPMRAESSGAGEGAGLTGTLGGPWPVGLT